MAAIDLVPISSPSPRRSTISTGFIPRGRKNGGNGQCTHLTTTRLFTEDFRCAICLRVGTFGWLYRCTQDRELLLEEDIENGFEVSETAPSSQSRRRMLKEWSQEKLDVLCDVLPKSIKPRKRSAAARLDKLSVLEEIGAENMKDYSGEQLHKILTQRAYLLDTLVAPDYSEFTSFPAEYFYSHPSENRPLPSPPGLPLRDISAQNAKPWLPLAGGECQFKCCHTCRPSLQDRSFLSLNGIANGDIPPTAITGFGFHLKKQRPVALVKHVKNLGLRPNLDLTTRPLHPTTHSPPRSPKKPTGVVKQNVIKRRPAALGLGIFPSEAQHQSCSTTTTTTSQPSTAPTLPPRTTPTIPIFPSTDTHDFAYPPIATSTTNRRHSYSPSPSDSSKLLYTLATVTPLPPPTPSEYAFNIPAAPLTPMEHRERFGNFSSAPLEVQDGVAVMEESVELHVPDVITQF